MRATRKSAAGQICAVFQLGETASTAGSVFGELDQLETASSVAESVATELPQGMTPQQAVEVYKNYNFEHKYDANLAITPYRQQVGGERRRNRDRPRVGRSGTRMLSWTMRCDTTSSQDANKIVNFSVFFPERRVLISTANCTVNKRRPNLGLHIL